MIYIELLQKFESDYYIFNGIHTVVFEQFYISCYTDGLTHIIFIIDRNVNIHRINLTEPEYDLILLLTKKGIIKDVYDIPSTQLELQIFARKEKIKDLI